MGGEKVLTDVSSLIHIICPKEEPGETGELWKTGETIKSLIFKASLAEHTETQSKTNNKFSREDAKTLRKAKKNPD